MIYDISLRIRYDYEQVSDAGRQVVRLLPADWPGIQRLVAGRIEVQPGVAERRDTVDFFGNPATELRFPGSESFVEYRTSARVERLARPPVLDLSPTRAGLAREIAETRSLAADAPHHFLSASPRVRPRTVMTSYAQGHLQAGMPVLEVVRVLGLALNTDMAFVPGATQVDTPPEEAFKARKGVCQDFTHIMIACLRGIGVPAGYVSGYLRTDPPPGQPRLEGADAMHAWVRAWCGSENGWVEFDPTNACFVGRDHVAVALGRDYSDVAPVHGQLRTAGGQTSRQEVTVRPLPGG